MRLAGFIALRNELKIKKTVDYSAFLAIEVCRDTVFVIVLFDGPVDSFPQRRGIIIQFCATSVKKLVRRIY